MDYNGFAADLKKRGLAPAYLFYGEETYLREKGVEALRAAHADFAAQTVRFSSSDLDWAKLAGELYTPPFLGSKKLVIVTDEGNFVHNHAADLDAYLAGPSAAAVAAFVLPSGKLPALKSKAAVAVECRSLRPADQMRWAEAEFQKRGKSADREAIQLLAERAGELSSLAGHVEKLCAYAGVRGHVTAEDVRTLVVGRAAMKPYELALAAAAKRPGRALELLHGLLADGEAPQMLLWKLAWQYRKLVEAKKLLASGRKQYEVTSRLQITFYAEEFLGFVAAHTLEELIAKHGRILEADLALKTSGGSDLAILEKLICELSSGTKSWSR